MKTLSLRLVTTEGDELELIPLEEFAIAEEPEEAPNENNEDTIERVDALYTTLLILLSERQAAPRRGNTWLKLALGKALLTADEIAGDVVIEVTIRPLTKGEHDDPADPEQN